MKLNLISAALIAATLTLAASASTVAVYKFDELSGDIAADSLRPGGIGDATLVNFSGSQWAAGQIGNALTFDGVNDYAWSAEPFAAGTTKLSISSWVYLDAVGGTPDSWATIVKCWPAAFHFGLNAGDGRLSNYLNGSGSGVAISPAQLGANAWHHVAFTYDGETGTHVLYIDNSAVVTVNTGVPAALNTDGTTMGIGVKLNSSSATTPSTDGSDGFWRGKIDDLAFFDHALSAGEVATIYNNGLAGVSVVPEPMTTNVIVTTGCALFGLRRRRRTVA